MTNRIEKENYLPGLMTSSSRLKEILHPLRFRDWLMRFASSIGRVDNRRLCAVLNSVKS